ncbi:MAG TPA: branched-chain amino acid ABC transporter permease, partial [Bellilinea sp.]|nr:branched-chain amino acid ABC transporter permease [Bellilinea sp.]
AFTTGTLLLKFNLTPWVGMFIGGLIAMGISALIGLPFFRFKIKELWYALSSSAMVEVFRVIFMLWGDVGGPTERYLPIGNTPAENWYNMRFYTYAPYFYIMLVLLIIVMLVSKYIRISKLGYSLLALGEDEDAAEVLGVNARKSKLTALMIYAFFGGLVGGVYACMYGFIHPSYFSIPMSTEVAILGIVGGLGLTYGPLFAAVLMVSLREYLRSSLGGGMEGVYLVVYSLILILVALFQPRGLYPLFQKLLDKVKQFIGRRDDARSTASKN